MKQWIQRILALIIVLAGTIFFLSKVKALLDWPHLYPDLGQLHLRNLIFLGLTLLLVGAAWVAGAYLMLGRERKLWWLLVPLAAFGLLLFLGTLTVREAVGTIPCSYTTSMAAYREEFAPKDFRVNGENLYPLRHTGEVTAYARYEKGEVLSESVTITYEKEDFDAEARRLRRMRLSAFHPKDTRDEVTCYVVEQDGATWQVLLTTKTKTVVYLRYTDPDRLPGFAPQPIQGLIIDS